MSESLTHGYSSESTQQELSNMNTNMRKLNGFQKNLYVLVLWMKVALALQGLIYLLDEILVPF